MKIPDRDVKTQNYVWGFWWKLDYKEFHKYNNKNIQDTKSGRKGNSMYMIDMKDKEEQVIL